MHALSLVTTLWLLALAVFTGVMVYRAMLTQHETDELFLDDLAEESNRKHEHDDIVRRVNSLTSVLKGSVGALGALTVAMLCVFIAQNARFMQF